jgi:hypothetical protein
MFKIIIIIIIIPIRLYYLFDISKIRILLLNQKSRIDLPDYVLSSDSTQSKLYSHIYVLFSKQQRKQQQQTERTKINKRKI